MENLHKPLSMRIEGLIDAVDLWHAKASKIWVYPHFLALYKRIVTLQFLQEFYNFLSYVKEVKRVYNKSRNDSSTNMNSSPRSSHLLTFLRVRSGWWTQTEELSYNRLQSEISRVIWSHKNSEIFCIMRDPTIFFGISHCVGLHQLKVELDPLKWELFFIWVQTL